MSKLTAAMVNDLEPREREYKVTDGGNLYVRVRPSGCRTWVYCYRMPGSKSLRKKHIGSCDLISIVTARREHKRLKRLVKIGLDPMEHGEPLLSPDQEVAISFTINDWYLKYSRKSLTKKAIDDLKCMLGSLRNKGVKS